MVTYCIIALNKDMETHHLFCIKDYNTNLRLTKHSKSFLSISQQISLIILESDNSYTVWMSNLRKINLFSIVQMMLRKKNLTFLTIVWQKLQGKSQNLGALENLLMSWGKSQIMPLKHSLRIASIVECCLKYFF